MDYIVGKLIYNMQNCHSCELNKIMIISSNCNNKILKPKKLVSMNFWYESKSTLSWFVWFSLLLLFGFFTCLFCQLHTSQDYLVRGKLN